MKDEKEEEESIPSPQSAVVLKRFRGRLLRNPQSEAVILYGSRSALVVLIVAALVGGIYFARRSGSDPEVYSNDFNVFYFAAREVTEGRDPYQNSLGSWTPYLYLPLLAELMIALAWLPLPIAAYLWFLISAATVTCAAWMSARLVAQDEMRRHGDAETRGHGEWRTRRLTTDHRPPIPHRWLKDPAARQMVIAAGSLLVVIRFVFDNFAYGQVNTVVACLAVAHLYLYAKLSSPTVRKGASMLAFVLAASIKLTPAVLIAYAIAKRRFKFAALCAAMLAAVTVLSFLPFGARGASAFDTFVHRTIKNEQGFDLAHSGNQSLRGAMARLTEESDDEARRPSNSITLIISIALLAISVFTAVFARNAVAAAAPFFCCLVLLSPLSWKAHFVALILPVAYLISQALEASGRRRYSIAAVLISATILFNFTSPKIIGTHASEWADAHSLVFAGALLIFIACVWTALRARFEEGL
ncbi:MAG: DUF2029 domain-containing protein [Blastocatellia bacterium]|nr:DUF2029 domain-containing protein [Blastocatellia bacterium]